MVDLTSEMAQLWSSLGPWVPGHSKVLQFASATRGEGVSTIAREFARLACERTRRAVWLIDADIPEAHQHTALQAEVARFGPLGAETPASPDGSAFFTVQPPRYGPDRQPWPDASYLGARQVGAKKLWVTRFRRDLLRGGQQIHIVPSDQYWQALRRHADVVIIDAPSADRSGTAAALARFVDTTVLVVAADGGDVRRTNALKESILGGGGACAGIVFNRAQVETPAFIRAILR
jgi:Mrp family chromosome partitioning ATPase